MTRVKVCGLTRETDLDAAVDAGADAVGVVCDVPVDTPREVHPARAADLLAAVPPFVTGVLVTMPSGPERAIELVERVGPDAVQIHGGLEPVDLSYLRASVDATVLSAVDAGDVDAAAAYDGVVDALVVDSVDEDGGGGTGETHDWERTAAATADLASPVVLAGGLDPGNVADAVRTVRPFAVDVASGVEARGGVKDREAVEAFVDRAKGARPAERRVQR
ncbi:phosphoribosylanthranilate isomerase [Salinilacihabitans rarus]|uniref:phosphoribosylanthranilate isomerase n=1 Tax=Salinilacihabitans rarus TaxID=2961596 RepID=UPI0020C8DD57|nr:phosphoribosylanthranilate isomerase [Salinilacihabitans rarus]